MRNLASRNAVRMTLMDLENDLRALDPARFTTDGIHSGSIKRQAWVNRAFQENLDKVEVELIDNIALITEEATDAAAIRLLCHLIWRNAWDQSQPGHKKYRARVSKNRGQTFWTDWVRHQREGPFVPKENWDQYFRRTRPQVPLGMKRRRRKLRAGKNDVQIEVP